MCGGIRYIMQIKIHIDRFLHFEPVHISREVKTISDKEKLK